LRGLVEVRRETSEKNWCLFAALVYSISNQCPLQYPRLNMKKMKKWINKGSLLPPPSWTSLLVSVHTT
jgi:hypothetical protein